MNEDGPQRDRASPAKPIDPENPAQSDRPGDTDAEIREKVRDFTSRVLGRGELDASAIEEVVRTVTGRARREHPGGGDDGAAARRALAEALAGLDDDLMQAAAAAHAALQGLVVRGAEFTDNDLKEAFTRLDALNTAYTHVVARMAQSAGNSLQGELRDLAVHAQRVGVDAGSRAAGELTEIAQRVRSGYRESAASGIETARDYGVRISMLASGVLAGIADALREEPGPDSDRAARPSRDQAPNQDSNRDPPDPDREPNRGTASSRGRGSRPDRGE